MINQPLAGIRILDLTRLLPGPLCTLHLADLGADVIKIEDTAAGDYVRHSPPVQKNMSSLFLSINRNKRSLVLDFQKEEGKKIFYKLVEKADVVVESYRPGIMKKMGLDYDTLKKINSGIIYCSITGYGQTGSNANKAGHDLNFTAEAGALYGRKGEKPQLPAFQMGDIAGGSLNAVMGILAAILQRQKTGMGQAVDVSMFDGLLAHSVVSLSFLAAGKEAIDYSGLLLGDLPCYNIYETGDGRHVALAALEYKFWKRFCEKADKLDWLLRHMVFGEESEKMKSDLSVFFHQKPLSEWMEIFADSDCCLSPVNSVREAIESPSVKDRGLVLKTEHPGEGISMQFSFPVKFSGFSPVFKNHAPDYGEHTNEILRQADYDEKQIAIFRAEKIIL